MNRNPLYCDGSSECMEVIGDIGECHGGGLSRGRFEGVQMLYGSLVVYENPYMSFGEVIMLTNLKAFLSRFKNTE